MKNRLMLFYPKNDKANCMKFLPLSILKVGSQLKSAGFDGISINERFEKDYENRLPQELDNATYLGVSVMTGYQIKGALKVSSPVKKVKNDIQVI